LGAGGPVCKWAAQDTREFGQDEAAGKGARTNKTAEDPPAEPLPHGKGYNRTPAQSAIARATQKEAAEAAAVIKQLSTQCRRVLPVDVPDQGRGFIHQGVALRDDPVKHLDVACTPAGGADVKGNVEETGGFEDLAAEGHVAADSETARPEQVPCGELLTFDDLGLEAVAHPAIAQFKKDLRIRFQFSRYNRSGHRHDVPFRKGAGNCAQPIAIRSGVVIGEGDNAVTCLGDPPITRPVQAGSLFAYIADRQARCNPRRVVIGRRIVNDNDLIVRIIDIKERLKTTPELRRPITSTDDKADRQWVHLISRMGEELLVDHGPQHVLPKLFRDHLTQLLRTYDGLLRISKRNPSNRPPAITD
jgi:hypothetical protein